MSLFNRKQTICNLILGEENYKIYDLYEGFVLLLSSVLKSWNHYILKIPKGQFKNFNKNVVINMHLLTMQIQLKFSLFSTFIW